MGTVIACFGGAPDRRAMSALIGERMGGRVMPYLDWTWDLDEVVMEWPAEVGLDGPDVAGCLGGGAQSRRTERGHGTINPEWAARL